MKKLLCALIALILCSCAFAEDAQQEEPVAAPDFVMQTMEGQEISFSELTGQPLLLNIWATWCPPCRNELPYFQQAFEKYGEQITFAMVSVDSGEDAKTEVEEYLKENAFTFPVYLDTESNSLMTYGIGSIPVTVLVDAEGNIIAGQVGMLDEELVGLCMAILLGEA